MPMLPPRLVSGVKRMLGRPSSFTNWLAPAFAQRVDINERLFGHMRSSKGPTYARRDEYEALAHGWPVYALELAERAYAAVGLEPRHPLYDRRIVEFAFAIPEEQRHGPNPTKYAMRNAMRGLLPESLRTRLGKGDFTHLFLRTLLNLGGSEFFRSLTIAKNGWIDSAKIQTLFAEAESAYNAENRTFRSYTWQLMGVADIELWFRAAF